jgi:hypothetical protein
MPGKHGG